MPKKTFGCRKAATLGIGSFVGHPSRYDPGFEAAPARPTRACRAARKVMLRASGPAAVKQKKLGKSSVAHIRELLVNSNGVTLANRRGAAVANKRRALQRRYVACCGNAVRSQVFRPAIEGRSL